MRQRELSWRPCWYGGNGKAHPSTALAGGLLAALMASPQSAFAAACNNQNTAAVTCTGVTTANNTERTTTNNTSTTVTITGVNNGFGIAAVQSGAINSTLTVTNSGSVTIDNPSANFTAQPALQLTGNGGLITYSGGGNISTGTFNQSNPALMITNTANGGGSIDVNTGTGTISGNGAITLSTAGTGSINLTTGGAITSSPLGSAISTTAVDGLNRVDVIGGTIQAAGFGIQATSAGTGGVTVNMSGGQINSGLFGITVASSGTTGDVFVTANTIFSGNTGVFASGSNAGTVRVDVNGAINSSTGDGVLAGGFGAVTVNVANNITTGNNAADAGVFAASNGLATVKQTAGVIQSTGDGISVGSISTGGVTVDMTGGQVGTSAATRVGGRGIHAELFGTTGAINITANPIFSTGNGIHARIAHTGNADNININVNPGATVNSAGAGIFAETVGTGNFIVTANGDISGASVGVDFVGGTTNSLTNVGAISGNIGVRTLGGTTALTNSGTITGTGGTALQIDSGTLQLGSGSGSLVGNVINNGVFAVNRSDVFPFGSLISGSGQFRQMGSGTTVFTAANSYIGDTFIDFGTLQLGTGGSLLQTGALTVNGGGTFDLNGHIQTVGDLSGAGNILLGAGTLTAGTAGSTTFSGVMSGAGSFVKQGTGTLVFTGANTYVGATTVNAGGLIVNGSIVSSSGLTVNGGSVGGTGFLPSTIVNNGALSPGNSIGTITVSGNLAFNAGSTYAVEFSPSEADRTNVTGTVTINGGTVQATALPGSFSPRSYVIINAAGGVSGRFGNLIVSGAPINREASRASLDYDANNVYLVLAPGTLELPAGASSNQSSVAGGINNAVLAGGTPPAAFDTLLNLSGPALTNALNQVSGQSPAGAAIGATQMMNGFLSLTLNPYGGAPQGNPGALGYARAIGAPEILPTDAADAFAAIMPAQAAPMSSDRRWNVWGQAFGGYNTTDGSAAAGTADTTARAWGFAAGADYRVASGTTFGFALAGGELNWRLAQGLGGGKSDVFQAGLYASHRIGAAYVSGAVAYAWYDMNTDRTVTVASMDVLRGSFDAHSVGGRLEAGYRLAAPWLGVTPYVAGQLQSFRTPAYSEATVSGANTFALSYGSRSTTAGRLELGSWFDKLLALDNGNAIMLRGRAAWAHDEGNGGGISAVFQTLPGSNFVVDGAAPPRDLVLVMAGGELRLANGLSLGARFDGEFAARAQTYSGTGTVRYVW